MRTHVMALALLAAAVGLGAAPAPAQTAGSVRDEAAVRSELQQLRERAERRFQVIEVRRGMILIPKAESARARTIDINDGQVAVDGAPLTGRELRERLGEDADLVARLSFLDAAADLDYLEPPLGPLAQLLQFGPRSRLVTSGACGLGERRNRAEAHGRRQHGEHNQTCAHVSSPGAPSACATRRTRTGRRRDSAPAAQREPGPAAAFR